MIDKSKFFLEIIDQFTCEKLLFKNIDNNDDDDDERKNKAKKEVDLN